MSSMAPELYAALAAAEPDPLRKDLFLQLGQARAGHAQLWRGKLAAAGIQDGPRRSHDTLAREELGIDPTELGGNPWSAAATSFALFSAGAIFPVAPFLWMKGHWAIGATVLASGAVLGAVGMLSSLFNGPGPWYSAARQLIFGCLAAAVTYGIGSALGGLPR